MWLNYIDIPGLSLTNHGEEVATLYGLDNRDDQVWLTPDTRLATLARLRHGAGVTIITGPAGKEFWLLASKEVDVRVEPDGYLFKERTEDEDEWSYRAAGVSRAEYGRIRKRKSALPESHGLFARAQLAARLRDDLPRGVQAEVRVDWEYRELTPGIASGLLTNSKDIIALDWEWDITTREPFDLGIYSDEGASVVHITPADVNLMRWMVGERQRRNLPTIWHGGRADLGKQHDTDPVELVDTPPHDSQIMAYLVGEPDLRLKHLTRTVLKRQVVEYAGDLRDLALDHRARYVCADVRNSFDLYHLYRRRLDATGQWSVYDDIERPLMPVIASMERYGMPVDLGVVNNLRDDVLGAETALRCWFMDAYGCDVSDDGETREWLKTVLGHDPGTLDQRVLSWYPNPEIDLLLFYRRFRTHRRSFLDKTLKLWEAAGRPDDFRVYPSFNQAGDPEEGRPSPRSGRLSSSGELNAQNQPGDLKGMYVPPPGYRWFDYDYSGIELRVAAAVSGEPTMMKAMTNGLDLHDMLRDRVERNTGTRPPRVVAKRWNFGKLYGAQLDKLIEILASIRIFIDRPTATAMEQATLDLFPQYPRWAQRVVSKSERDGYSITWWGRRRYLPELADPDPAIRAHGANAAVNHVVQGSAADLIKMAIVKLAKMARQYDAHISNSVHDAIGGWVPNDRAVAWDKTARVVLSSFRVVDSIPMLVEGAVGNSWGECH